TELRSGAAPALSAKAASAPSTITRRNALLSVARAPMLYFAARMRLSVDDAGAQAPRPAGALDESRFCIFVPSYNASKHLPGTIARVPWPALPAELTYRMVFVDNQSTDDTWQVIQRVREQLVAEGRDIDAIRNPRNLGYGGSNKVIFDYCIRNDFGLLGILHSDGQYLPEELP